MKKTLLFDGRVFADAIGDNISRTGIYFVAFNVLKHLYASDLFDITILTNPYDSLSVKEFIKTQIWQDIKSYFDGVKHLDLYTKAKCDFIRYFEENILKPRNLDYKIQFPGPTGTNAVESALKLARKVKKRNK